MWQKIGMLALLVSLLPLGACAQSNDSGNGPSPEMRAKMDAARADAKTASLAALDADHRMKVQAIVDGFDATGSTLTVKDAAAQIDAVLSKSESSAVLDQQHKMRESMRAAFEARDAQSGSDGPPPGGDGGPGGGGPGGGPGGGGPPGGFGGGGGPGGPGGGPGGGAADGAGPGGFGGRHRSADAGRFLLSVAATPERFRSAMQAERGTR